MCALLGEQQARLLLVEKLAPRRGRTAHTQERGEGGAAACAAPATAPPARGRWRSDMTRPLPPPYGNALLLAIGWVRSGVHGILFRGPGPAPAESRIASEH